MNIIKAVRSTAREAGVENAKPKGVSIFQLTFLIDVTHYNWLVCFSVASHAQ